MSGAPQVLVHLSGPLRVDRGGTKLAGAELGSRKGRTLLRLLAARRGDVLTGAEIAGVLWPQESPSNPDAVVASLVSRLRRVLGPDAVLGGREGYRLGAVETDVALARQLLADAERAAPAAAGAGAAAALALLEAGEASAVEPDDDWLAPVRSDVSVLRRRARHLVARTALETGEADAAEDAARRALSDDPLDEEAVRLLMRALLARDLPAEALRTYELLRRALADELGTDPAPATRTLLRRCPARGGAGHPRRGAARPTDCGSRAATRSSACSARSGTGPAGTAPDSSSCPGNPASARAACSRSWPTPRAGPAVRCCPGGRSRVSGRCSPSRWSTRWRRPPTASRPSGSARLLGATGPWPGSCRSSPRSPTPPRWCRHRRRLSSGRRASPRSPGSCADLARGGPVLVAVDDLQRAGRSTVELLHYLARHLGSAQVLLAAAVRTGEGEDAVELLRATSRRRCRSGRCPHAAVARPRRAGRAREPRRRRHAAYRRPPAVRRRGAAGAGRRARRPAGLAADGGGRPGGRHGGGDRAADARRRRARVRRSTPWSPASWPASPADRGAAVVRARASPHGCSWRVAGSTSSRTTSSGRRCSPRRRRPTRLAWHARAADLLVGRPGGGRPATRRRSATGRAPPVPGCTRPSAALARFVASDAILLATRAAALATELDDAELGGRALVVRGRANDAAAHFAAALDDYTAARDAARRAGDRRLRDDGAPRAGRRRAGGARPPARRLRAGARRVPAAGWDARGPRRWRPTCWAGWRCSAARSWTSPTPASSPAAGWRPAARPRTSGPDARGLDAVKTACAYLGLVDELASVVAELEPVLRRTRRPLDAAVVGVRERVRAAGRRRRRGGARPDRGGAGGLPAQRLHRLRAVLRRAPGLGAPAGRPAGPDARREGRRAVELADAAPPHLVVDDRGRPSTPATLLACGEPDEAAAVLRPAAAGGRRGRCGGLPAPLPRTAGGGDRRPGRAASGPTPCCAASGHRRAARGCSVPTPTWRWPAPGGGPGIPTGPIRSSPTSASPPEGPAGRCWRISAR